MLTLNMIVKNEACGITRTLDSCRGVIDRYDIVDTGSTDGTQEAIQLWAAAAGVPGTVYSAPFSDFSTTRNLALDLAGGSTWALLLSGDEIVVRSQRVREFLTSSSYLEHHATVSYDPWEFGHVRLVRPALCGRYVGVTHETLVPKRLGPRAPLMIRGGRQDEDRRARWRLDRKLLEAELPKGDPRTLFYLAQTYECLGLNALAVQHYQRRAALELGSKDEQWEAILRAGRLGAGRAWLDLACELRPWRAEPWFYLAEWYRRVPKDLDQALICAEEAAACPYPPDGGFIEASIYRGRATALVVALLNLRILEPATL